MFLLSVCLSVCPRDNSKTLSTNFDEISCSGGMCSASLDFGGTGNVDRDADTEILVGILTVATEVADHIQEVDEFLVHF